MAGCLAPHHLNWVVPLYCGHFGNLVEVSFMEKWLDSGRVTIIMISESEVLFLLAMSSVHMAIV